MRNIAVILLLFAFSPLSPVGSVGSKAEHKDYRNCVACHKGIEKMSASHDLSCISCHVRPEDRSKSRLLTHQVIVRNPSAPSLINTFCADCHKKEIERVSTSLHSTMAGIINQTRYLWGAQERAVPAIFGLGESLRQLPEPGQSIYPEKPAQLVDDFLRRRCLRCHIHSKGAGGAGLYRASGCAACHVLYADDGVYRGKDKAIPKDIKGYPVIHSFTTRINNSQCLHCHNHNHVGADYEGLFEHDYGSTYRSPVIEGKPAPRIYGMNYHHLARDIHAEKGLWCIDCHDTKDVMGNGKTYNFELQVPILKCTECHGGFRKEMPGISGGPFEREAKDVYLVLASGARRVKIPPFSKKSVAHQISEHRHVRCSACHAQWSFQDYGLSIIREDASQGYKWYGLTAQGAPSLEEQLNASMKRPLGTVLFSKDYVNGRNRPGIWSQGWRFRRWEWMPLGIDQKNQYSVLRPLYQYLISYIDRLGNIALDSMVPERGDGSGRGWAFAPYVPHTIAPIGRQCDTCHGNRVAAGLGSIKELTSDTSLVIPSPPAISSMRLLNSYERNQLMKPTERYKKERLRALLGISR